jgi:RNA polymerase sigma-70 factor (ECF subfamily)
MEPRPGKPSPVPNESQHIAHAREGDKDAYRLLVEAYQDRVFGLTFSMVRNREQAEDLTQEIFVKAYFALASFKGDSAFYTWLYRISSNACLDFLRKHKLPVVSLDQTLDAEEDLTRLHTVPAPESEHPEAVLEKEGEVTQLLQILEPDQRLILTLREAQGYSYEEIGEMLKCGVNTVKSKLFRAREALQEAYQNKFGPIAGNKSASNYVEKSEETL